MKAFLFCCIVFCVPETLSLTAVRSRSNYSPNCSQLERSDFTSRNKELTVGAALKAQSRIAAQDTL